MIISVHSTHIVEYISPVEMLSFAIFVIIRQGGVSQRPLGRASTC